MKLRHASTNSAVRTWDGSDRYLLLSWSIFFLFISIPFFDVSVGILAKALGLYSGYEAQEKLATLIPGIVIRAGILVAVFASLFSREQGHKNLWYLYVLLTALLASEYFAFFNHQSIGNLFLGLTYVFKIILIITISIYLLTIHPGHLLYLKAETIALNALLVYVFAIVVGHLLKYEYVTYGGLGSSGFLISGSANSVSLAFLIGAPFLINRFIRADGKGKIFWSFIYLLCLYASMLLLTKASILSLLIILAVSLLYGFSRSRLGVKLVLVALVGILAVVLIITVDFSSLTIVKRVEFLIEYHDGAVWKILLSGRDRYMLAAQDIFVNEMPVFQQILGAGYQIPKEAMEWHTGHVQGVEVDFGDLLVKSGFVGAFLYGVPVLMIFLKSIVTLFQNTSFMHKLVCLVFILMVFQSSIAGHVFMSGMLGFMIPFSVFFVIRGKEYFDGKA
ncbi:O-antigen ligase family protein [Emcibacter sp.]|uniref:O-antigen ligase family protein n=1 Tax=Emcibacter sp. TaxID=1979954 RepID=UPI002AA8AA83|nr:O-antigen ligase family protein [Emcibacter sp.]